MYDINCELVLLDEDPVDGNAVVIKRGAKYITLEYIHWRSSDVYRANKSSFESLETEDIIKEFIKANYGKARGIFRHIGHQRWKLYKEERTYESLRMVDGEAEFVNQVIKVHPQKFDGIGIYKR